MIFGLVGWQATIIIVAFIAAGTTSIGVIAWAVKAIFTANAQNRNK